MKSLVARIKAFGNQLWGAPNRDLVLSSIQVRHNGVLYRASAVYDGVRVTRVPEGHDVLFSVETGSPHTDLVLEVFDGFAWNTSSLAALIAFYERQSEQV